MANRPEPSQRVSRRDFLRRLAVAAGGLSMVPILQACSGYGSGATSAGGATPPPAAPTSASAAAPTAVPTTARIVPGAGQTPAAGGKQLTLLIESAFVKEFDDYFTSTLAPAYQKETGVVVNYDPVSVGSLQTKVTAAIETKSGPDLGVLEFNWAFLYDDALVDVSDIGENLGKQYGGWYDAAREACVVNGKWKAIPIGNIGECHVYRKDWFDEVGATTFPETWDELLEVGAKLKEKGHPLGLTMGHGFGDNHSWEYPLLWSFGAHEVDETARKVTLDSPETEKAVEFVKTLFQKAQLPDVLGWTDPSNNKAFFGEQISDTVNASSILTVAKRDFPNIAPNIGIALNPKGPTGQRYHMTNPWSIGIFNFSPNVEEAKKFLAWLNEQPHFQPWIDASQGYYVAYLHAYDDDPIWKQEPRLGPYKEQVASAHLPGWPAAPGRAASESLAKYVIVDMFAKAAQGQPTKSVISDAAAQIKQIYNIS